MVEAKAPKPAPVTVLECGTSDSSNSAAVTTKLRLYKAKVRLHTSAGTLYFTESKKERHNEQTATSIQ